MADVTRDKGFDRIPLRLTPPPGTASWNRLKNGRELLLYSSADDRPTTSFPLLCPPTHSPPPPTTFTFLLLSSFFFLLQLPLFHHD
ncbi:hypothetical protein K504DRAFT_121558 [Pleomassaria siparia CBS 279.74]|uniref:Uncharacterized protein n=1 Tax=Pleomassaria siparia CBS 279.74 TaxID=1314801 RepID=A0A6G1JWT0_9PLEO|nr:hypothetical protein K504DRAFT_121558 [Pleomassaria siparia CBS 279.74]